MIPVKKSRSNSIYSLKSQDKNSVLQSENLASVKRSLKEIEEEIGELEEHFQLDLTFY